MAAVDPLTVGAGVVLAALTVVLHFSRGQGWDPKPDVSQEVLEQRAETVTETDFPEPMNRAVGGGAAAGAVVGEEGSAELADAAEEESDEPSPADIPEDEVEYFEVEFVKEGETIEVANNENILEAGEDQGWDMPYACRQGQCVSCSGQITSGGHAEDYVVHDDQEMFEDDELADGYTLTCVAYPKSDLTLETGESP